MFAHYLSARVFGVLLAVTLGCTNVMAQAESGFRWHGFFDQGAIYTDENNFFGDSTNTSFDYRNAGLGFSWQMHEKILISVQGLYRDAGETSPEGVKTDYAMLNYSVVNSADFGLSLRVGRVKNPFAFYNETRDVAATRPSIILPISVYVPAFRDIYHSSDSVMVSAYKELGDWLINVDLLRGSVPFDNKSERLLIPDMQAGSLEDDRVWVLRSIVDYDGGRARIGVTYIDFDARLDTTSGTIFPGDIGADSYLLSFEYNWAEFQWVTEYLTTKVVYKDVFAPGLDNKRQSEGYYFQLGYRVNNKLRIFGRYDAHFADKDDRSGRGQLLLGRPKSDGFTKSYVLGAQYRFNDQWMLAGEVHHLKGTEILPRIENQDASKVKEDWNLYTLQLSYKF